MNKMKLLFIGALQGFTSVIQLKGIPKFINLSKKVLFQKDQVYKVYNNIKIKINPAVNFHCQNVLNYGGYETIKIFENHLKKGDTYIDIGTNLGYMSLNAERIVGKEGSVISFEPDATILPLLKENKLINNSGITIVEKAASEKQGIEIFNIATESGLSRLANEQVNLFGLELLQQKEVKTDTLDNILNELIPRRVVNLIKIDVEGHELKVLRGGIDTLRNYKPVLILEINHEALGQNNISYVDILQFLKQFSYKFYVIESHSADWLRFSRKPSFKLIEEGNEEQFAHKPFDLLCK
jgi:FkbM family methyltransferase